MDKRAVAEHFSQAARSYDEAAHLQRRVADQLLQLLQPLSLAPDHVADLGTGTGYCLPFLKQRFQPQRLTALDISADMLNVAETRVPDLIRVQADLEAVPFAPDSIDLATSSLAVQWLDQPEPFISRMAHALKPGGCLALATLGPKTLCELRQAWAQVDSGRHVNDFHHAVDWIEAVWESPLELTLWREQRIEVRYDQPLQLLTELKKLGANHVDRQEPARGAHLRRMLKQYQSFRRSDGRYPASWDVFFLIARKPDQ